MPFATSVEAPILWMNGTRGRAVQQSVPRLERVLGRFVFATDLACCVLDGVLLPMFRLLIGPKMSVAEVRVQEGESIRKCPAEVYAQDSDGRHH